VRARKPRAKFDTSSLIFEIARDKKALEKAYNILKGSRVLGLDTEAGGFVPQKYPLWSLQLSNVEYSVLVPFNALKTIGPLQRLLSDKNIVKVAHNGKFDLKFLKFNGIDVENLHDTMITESLLNAGREFKGKSKLADLSLKYVGYEMSKAERTDFYDGTFARDSKVNPMKAWTPDRIDYSLDDAWVLPLIYWEQIAQLQHEEMSELSEVIEQPLVARVIPRMELLGVAMDTAKTEAFGDKMQEKADALREQLAQVYEPLWQKHWRPLYAEEMKIWTAWETPYKELKKKASAKYFDSWWKREWADKWANLIKKAQSKESKAEIRERRDEEYKKLKQHHLETYKPQLEKLRAEKPFTSPPKERKPVSITSNQQLSAALAQAGVHLPNMQKVTLEDMAGQNETLDLLLDFRKYEKLAKYRTVILEELNEVTGRVHPDINQIVSTGRFSISHPPLQQIPVKTDEGKELRSCFIAPAGRRLVAADYSAIELVLIGALSKDKNLLEAIRRQEDKDFDLHAFTMSKFLRVEYEELIQVKAGENPDSVTQARARFEQEVQIPELTEAPDLQTWFKRLRDVVKTLTYGIAYGLSEFGLSRKFHMSTESAATIIRYFYEAYPGVKKFIQDAGEAGLRLGYSLTPMGRRRYFNIPVVPTVQLATRKVIEEMEDDLFHCSVCQSKGFEPSKTGNGCTFCDGTFNGEEEPQTWANTPRQERERLVQRKLWEMKKEREWMLSAIKRQAANAPIQGASADMTKLAMVLFEQKTRHFPFEDFLRLTVHDELLAEVGLERAEEAAKILEESMVEAAYTFLPRDIPVKAEAKISTHWDK
jgi:DNA polymerase I-like protein with 3'-5' exonuclease and polymerase domains